MNYPWVKQANAIFTAVLLGQGGLSLIIAFFSDAYFQALFGSLLLAAVPLVLLKVSPYERSTRICVGIAVQLMAALHIQLAMGLTELHFEIFVLLAFLSFYRDWQVVLASVVTVAVHHVLFFVIQSQGGSIYVFEEGHVTFGILVIHALFAVAEAAVLIYVTTQIQKEAVAANAISQTINDILQQDHQFNLSVDIDTNNPALSEFAHLIGSFKDLISRARSTSVDVCEIAQQVKALMTEIESDATANASNVSSIKDAIGKMTHTNESVAKRALEANSLAGQSGENTLSAKETIKGSGDDISILNGNLHEASTTVTELAAMCGKIDDAMASIKTVSDQTNLLALNAAIESARAGEHGRGFAVVADEVRQLATTTSNNADEISGITASLVSEAQQSVDKINHCVERAENTKKSSANAIAHMEDVSESTVKLSQNIDTVAIALEQQADVSASISDSAEKLNESTNTQHHKISEGASSIAKLLEKIEMMNAGLSQFRI